MPRVFCSLIQQTFLGHPRKPHATWGPVVQREAGAPALAKGWAVGGDREAAHGHAAWKERTEGLARSCKRTHEESKTVQGPQKPAGGLQERPCANHKEEWVRVCRALGDAGWSRASGQEGQACTETQSLQGQAELRVCWSASSRACGA